MTEAQAQPHPLDDITANIRRNVRIVMAAANVRATTLYRALGISRQTWSSRLAGGTRFSAAEVVTLADLLDVSVEELAGSTAQLVQGHHWKLMTPCDLPVLQGGGQSDRATRNGQGRLSFLYAVPDLE